MKDKKRTLIQGIKLNIVQEFKAIPGQELINTSIGNKFSARNNYELSSWINDELNAGTNDELSAGIIYVLSAGINNELGARINNKFNNELSE